MLCLLTSNKFYQLYFLYVKSLIPMGLAYELLLLLRLKWESKETKLEVLFITHYYIDRMITKQALKNYFILILYSSISQNN